MSPWGYAARRIHIDNMMTDNLTWIIGKVGEPFWLLIEQDPAWEVVVLYTKPAEPEVSLCPIDAAPCGLTCDADDRRACWEASLKNNNKSQEVSPKNNLEELERTAKAVIEFKPTPDVAQSRAEEAMIGKSDDDCRRKIHDEFRSACNPNTILELIAQVKQSDQRPICSQDGCYRREPCGLYCQDNGNLTEKVSNISQNDICLIKNLLVDAKKEFDLRQLWTMSARTDYAINRINNAGKYYD
jgi:hypothetical protein